MYTIEEKLRDRLEKQRRKFWTVRDEQKKSGLSTLNITKAELINDEIEFLNECLLQY